jgi:hypothetical protein
VVGAAAVAVAIAVIAVLSAFNQQTELNRQQEQRLNPTGQPSATGPAAPGTG